MAPPSSLPSLLEAPVAECREASNRARPLGGTQAGSVKKVGSRKSRAKPKPPIKELLAADELAFKDMVHQFTGRKDPPPPVIVGNATQDYVLAGALARSLWAIDTISALLLKSTSSQNALIIQDADKTSSQSLQPISKQTVYMGADGSLQKLGSMITCDSPSWGPSPCIYAGSVSNALSGSPTNILNFESQQANNLALLPSLLPNSYFPFPA